jgi:hypothetical protein
MQKLERITTPAEVKGDLRDALKIVNELNPPVDLRLAVFQLAAQAIAQRAMVQHPVANLTPETMRAMRAG